MIEEAFEVQQELAKKTLVIKVVARTNRSSRGNQSKWKEAVWEEKKDSTPDDKEDIWCTAEQLSKMVDLLVDNVFVCCGGRVYKQDIGIPMGTDCAPFLANLYLFALEYAWVERMKAAGDRRSRTAARSLIDTSRFIDDLCILNGGDGVREILKQIYPEELVLTQTNPSPHTNTFLDLRLTVNDGRFVTCTYDKRDDFPFEICSFPNLSANVHFRRAHGVVVGALLRFAKANRKDDFFKRVRALMTRLVKQGFSRRILYNYAVRFHHDRRLLVGRFAPTATKFASECFA